MTTELADLQLPSGWELAKIGEKFAFTGKPKGLRFGDSQTIPFVPMERIPSDRLYFSDFTLKTPQEISSGTYFEEGDLLVSKITPCFENGKQGIAIGIPGGFGIATTEVIPIKSIGRVSYSPFLAMYLLHPDVRNRLAGRMEGATGRQRLQKSVLEEWTMPFPPLPEQRAIAGVLAKIQAAVEVQEKVVATLRELKAATMAKLFREGLHGEPLKQTEIGEIPESWKLINLGSRCMLINYGTSVRCSVDRKGRPVLRIPNVIHGGIDTTDLKWVELPDREASKVALELGDIVFVRTNGNKEYLGRCAVYGGEPAKALFASYLIRTRLDQSVLLPAFVQAYLSSIGREQITSKAHAASDGKYNIDTGVLRSVLVPCPSVEEQQAFVKVLGALDARLKAAQQKLYEVKHLFSSMLHRLMTGQVRVTRKMIALRALEDRRKRRPRWSGEVDEKALEEIVKRIVDAAAPEKIILFGPAARGEMGPDSDLDLLVVKSCNHPREIERLVRRSLIGIHIPKDILVVTPEHLKQHEETVGYIYRPALREGKVIYERKDSLPLGLPESVERFVSGIAQRFTPERIILFGSYADGTATLESDVDLLVVMRFEGRARDQAARIDGELERSFPLDLLVRRPEDVERALEMGDPFMTEIVQKGAVLYARPE